MVQGEALPDNPMADKTSTICWKGLGLRVAGSAVVVLVGCNHGGGPSTVK